MQKTLGGDRLGAGKKMQVHLHNYERSTHDLGYLWRSTMSAGTLVPFLCEVALPGDTFDINLDCDIKTHPTIGPLFGSYKVQLDLFLCPIRLYQAQLHNNTLGIGRNMSQIKLPQIRLRSISSETTTPDNPDNMQINPSALPSYLGIRGIGLDLTDDGETEDRYFNAIPILAYWETYKCYYANKQEEIGAVIHVDTVANVTTVDDIDVDGTTLTTSPAAPVNIPVIDGSVITVNFTPPAATPLPEQITITSNQGEMQLSALYYSGSIVINTTAGTITGTIRADAFGITNLYSWKYQDALTPTAGIPRVETFPLENIDLMKKALLTVWSSTAFVINGADLTPYKWLAEQPQGIPNILSSQEGLAIKTYQSDLFNNWLKTENIDDITNSTAIDTTSGSFTLDTLNLSRKVYNMLNRINVSGGSYDDWIDAVYTHEKYDRCESPMYMGGLIKELVFQEVVSNADVTGQPLGSLAGKGILSKKHKGGHNVIKVDEPSYILGIISLTPRIDYSQGNKWDVNLKTMDDFHKPALDEIGFQELITEQMAWWDTQWNGTEWIQKSAGKQPAWVNYMTNVNQTRGNFATQPGETALGGEMFMTLNRRYEYESGTIADLTTYIDPSKFNFIFAETSLDAQNFWAQIAVDITARRKMSAKIMPNL